MEDEFNEEWKNELMKCDKGELVDWLADILRVNAGNIVRAIQIYPKQPKPSDNKKLKEGN